MHGVYSGPAEPGEPTPAFAGFGRLATSEDGWCDFETIRPGAPGEAAFFDDLPEYVEAASALGLHGRLFTTAEAFDAQLEALGL